jgi:hypothetical protein
VEAGFCKSGAFPGLDGNQAACLYVISCWYRKAMVAGRLPPEMMALSEAAAVAHERVFCRTGELSEGTLEAIALALSARLDIFGVRGPGAGLTQLTKDDCFAGTFRRGAARLEFADGSVIRLAVRKADFMRLLDWLVVLGLFRTPLAM